MPTHSEVASPDEKSERAPSGAPGADVLGSPEPGRRVCPICTTPLTGRQRSACSPKHRAALSRRKRIPLRVAEAREIKASLTLIRDTAGQIMATLERYHRKRGA